MSLLNFLFRDRAEKRGVAAPRLLEAESPDEPALAQSAEASSVALAEEDPSEEPTSVHSFESADGTPDLESIRAALLKIAEIIHDDEDEEVEDEDAGNVSIVELTPHQIADLIPGVFKAGAPLDGHARKLAVRVTDLFGQLRTGKVQTSMSRVLAEVPAEWLARPAHAVSRDDVSIPLSLAVSSVRADELVKRTPTTERNPELKDMPNLFSMGSAAAAKAVPPRPKTVAVPPKGNDLFAPARPKTAAVPPKSNELFAPAPRAAETTIKAPLPDSVQPGSDMFRRTSAKPPPAEPPARSGPVATAGMGQAPKGFVFEFNEAATPFRRADEVKDEVPFNASNPVFAQFAEPIQPAAQAPVEPVRPVIEPPVQPVFEPPVRMEEPPAPKPVVAAPPPPEPVVAAPPEPKAAVAKPLIVMPPAAETVELHGIDINRADAEALAANIPGVGVRMAARIIRYREQQGPYTCVQDLASVPGVGPSTYEKMTGASWSEARDELRRTLDHLLGKPSTDLPDLRQVARRFAHQPGFSGCILVHKDGHVLSAEWPEDQQEIVGAIAPQIFKKLSPYSEQLGFGEVNPITLCFGESVLTLVFSGEILIVTLHEISRLDKSQLRLIQLAGAELEHRMERRRPSQDL